MSNTAAADSAPTEAVSVVLPVFNEESCIESTITELVQAMRNGARPFEVIAVNDGSTDATVEILIGLKATVSELRVVSLSPNSGQSAAFGAGFKAARYGVIVTMDADGQNDPADIEGIVDGLCSADVCCGYRANRKDRWSKRAGSRLARLVRNAILREDIIDTGCSLKAFKAEYLRSLMMFEGMHRFLPTLCMMQGAEVRQVAVNHRPRTAGKSKYTNLGRLRKTIWDLRVVRWMKRRYGQCSSTEI